MYAFSKMLSKFVIKQLSLSWSVILPCSAKASPPINLPKGTEANSIMLYCRTDTSTCLSVLIDKL